MDELSHDIRQEEIDRSDHIQFLNTKLDEMQAFFAEKLDFSQMEGTTERIHDPMENRSSLTWTIKVDPRLMDQIEMCGSSGAQASVDHVSKEIASDLIHGILKRRFENEPALAYAKHVDPQVAPPMTATEVRHRQEEQRLKYKETR